MTETTLTPTLVEPDDGFTLRLQRKPESIVAEARLCADSLIAAVKRNNWVQRFGGRDHLFFEAWAFLATMYRCTPRTVETRFVQIGDVCGYEATAECFHVPSGIVISRGDSMCLNDEDNWSMRPIYEYNAQTRRREHTGERPVPLFQLRSMAQTRAQAKALKSCFSWIVAMAGYAPTPVEDMSGSEASASVAGSASAPASVNQAEATASPSHMQAPRETRAPEASSGNGRGLITGKQASRIWALGFSAGLDKKLVGHILNSFGFQRAEEVSVERYDEICAAIENAAQPQGK